eukprot:scaffold74377_cov60-Phaeocystis_antarctica.AAC.4
MATTQQVRWAWLRPGSLTATHTVHLVRCPPVPALVGLRDGRGTKVRPPQTASGGRPCAGPES